MAFVSSWTLPRKYRHFSLCFFRYSAVYFAFLNSFLPILYCLPPFPVPAGLLLLVCAGKAVVDLFEGDSECDVGGGES